MEPLIRFFVGVSHLKTVQRPGWLLRGVKNPETVADHAFRVLILAWIFGKETHLNTKRLLKLALVHSLSAAHIDYISPYADLLNIKNKKELLKKYPAFVLQAPVTEKGKIVSKRFEEEKKVVEKLIDELPESTKQEIFSLWLDFQQKTSREAKFLKALDRLENLIQALEYKDQIEKEYWAPFLSQIGLVTDNKRILGFAQSLSLFFTKGEKYVKRRRDRDLIKFIIEAGKLKTISRKGWLIRGVKDPESLATHCFASALVAWVLSARRRIDQEAVIVMLLVHNLFATVIGDTTPYDRIIEAAKDKKKLLESLPWFGSQRGKEVIAVERLQTEGESLDKVIKFLPSSLRHEIKYLWLEYKTGVSREARFARQADRIEDIIQAMEYYKKDKSIPVRAFWLELKELIDDPFLATFVEQLDYYFLQQGKN